MIFLFCIIFALAFREIRNKIEIYILSSHWMKKLASKYNGVQYQRYFYIMSIYKYIITVLKYAALKQNKIRGVNMWQQRGVQTLKY